MGAGPTGGSIIPPFHPIPAREMASFFNIQIGNKREGRRMWRGMEKGGREREKEERRDEGCPISDFR